MPKSAGRFNSLFVPIITWLVLLIPFAIYQRYYVQSQEAYFTDHGFRLLASAGRQLGAYIDSVTTTVKTGASLPQKPNSPDDQFRDYLTNFLPELSIPLKDSSAAAAQEPKPVFTIKFGSGSKVFTRSFPTIADPRSVSLDTAIQLRLRGIGEDYFDDILIATSDGDVLYQRSLDRRVANLKDLLSDGIKASSSSPSSDGKTSPASPAFSALSKFSNVLEVQLAGDGYKLFLQPFPLSAAGANVKDSDDLVICGLWKTSRLTSDSFSLPYSAVIWFGLICVAAGSFLWPFLKVNYMNRTERLRRADGWFLIISVFIGGTAGALMVLNSTYYLDAEQAIDRDLSSLSAQISSKSHEEIGRALSQLQTLSADPLVTDLAEKPWNPRTRLLSEPGRTFDYPYFEMAFWMDRSGQQLAKFTTGRQSTPQTRLGDRQYFRDVNSADLPTAPRLAVMNGYRYSMEPIVSSNTGQVSTALATPFSPEGSERSDRRIRVSALVTRPLSLVDPVLPPDFGFAVLKPDGQVLFHSNPLRNLSENFFDECKDPSDIRSAVFSGSSQFLNVDYSGLDRRVLVTSIDKLGPEPLTLVVFHNTDLIRTISLAMILTVAVLFGVYLLIILIIAGFDLFSGAAYPPTMIWPCRENSPRYVIVCVFNTLLVLAFVAIYSHLWELSLLVVTTVALVFGILGTMILLTTKRLSEADTPWKVRVLPGFKTTYVLAAVSLLVITTIIPSFGFYKFAHDAVNELAARHGQLTVMRSLAAREDRIRTFVQAVDAPAQIAKKRELENLDRYDGMELEFLTFNKQEGTPEDQSSWLKPVRTGFDEWLAWAAHLFPSNRLGDEMRMLHFENSGPWSELSRNTFRLQSDEISVDSRFREWTGIGVRGWLWLSALWFLIGCWFFLLMKRIFVPDSQNSPPLEQVEWNSASDIQFNALVLCEPQFGDLRWLENIHAQHSLDLCVELEQLKNELFVDNSLVVIRNFDFRIDSRPYNELRLELLERLIHKHRCRVVLISAVDVIYHLSDGNSASLAETPSAVEDARSRWTRVMSSFQIVTYIGRDRSGFNAELDRRREDPSLRSLVQWIKHECSHTSYLRTIGLELLREHTGGWDPEALHTELLERADSYYRLLWTTLSSSERLTLYQLARDGWANTKNDRAIWQLQRKGFIRSAPMFRIANDSFRRFVLKAQDQIEIAEWEQQGAQSSWRTVKISLIATAVGLAAWLFYAQKDLFQGAMAYILTLGAAITTIANALGTFRGRTKPAAKSSEASS